MTTTAIPNRATAWQPQTRRALTRLRDYFASDGRRVFQTALGLIWLLDGALQFQPFMYSKGFISVLTGTASGQPHWLSSSIDWAAHVTQHDLTLFNTLFALVQVSIGLGLLYRRTVKPALAVVPRVGAGRLVVQRGVRDAVRRHGEPAHGRARRGTPLRDRRPAGLAAGAPGGLLGARGARAAWVTLWLVMAWSWLQAPNSSANATTDAIMSAPGWVGCTASRAVPHPAPRVMAS